MKIDCSYVVAIQSSSLQIGTSFNANTCNNNLEFGKTAFNLAIGDAAQRASGMAKLFE